MIACEHLQLDPLVIVARSHDLMLHSRVARYEPRFFDELAYDDRLFFDWGGWLAVRPMAELPYWRSIMRRDRDNPGMRIIAELHGDAIAEMRGALRERGTLANRDVAAVSRRAVMSYRGSKDASLALYYLWRVGEAMTHRRDRFERVYALTEAVAPSHLLTEASDDDTDRFMARKAVAFAGIGRPGPLSTLLARNVGKDEEQSIERRLVESGDIAAVEVEGWRGRHFAIAGDLGLLNEVDSGRVPADWAPLETTTETEVTLLSPLDPVIERRRAKALFDFEYVWEIYKKKDLVRFGRYTMPILWGDRLAGRIDPRMDRRSKTLVINGIWLDNRDDASAPQFRDALRQGLRRAMVFLETDRVDATAVSDKPLRREIASLNARRHVSR
jgi:uncharacterized protein YcaQ